MRRALNLVLLSLAVAVGTSHALARDPGSHAARTAAQCKLGRLPDRACTPGATFRGVTRQQVCIRGRAKHVRNVPESLKRSTYAEYGVRTHHRGQFEVDHLVPLELGGSNAATNLWPEPAAPTPGFHEKDHLENALHALVCSGRMSLKRAQGLIKRNWVSAYRRYVL